MLKFFIKGSVSKKLMLITTITAGTAVFVALLVSSINDIFISRETSENQLMVLADVVARNSASAIIFNDYKEAAETLSALQANKNIVYAELVDKNQSIIASYTRHGESAHINQQLHFKSPIGMVLGVFVERDIIVDKEKIGTLRVSASLNSLWMQIALKLLINIAGFVISLTVSYLAIRRMRKYILGPIQKLVETTREIIEHKEYSLRVDKTSDDELGILTDEFNQMLAQIEMRDSLLHRSSEALAQAQQPIILRDADLRCQYVNPAFTALFGYSLEEVKGELFSLRVKPQPINDESQIEEFLIARNEGVFSHECYRQTRNGGVIPLLIQLSPIKDSADNITGYVSVITDMSEKKKAEEIIWHQANFDGLTGLPNRHMFHDRLAQEMKKASRSDLLVAVVFIDLDHFKEINDTLGHDYGDILLKEVAERLTASVRQTDTVSRLGGDEFTIIISDLAGNELVDQIMQSVLQALAAPFNLGIDIVNISASIGVTLYPEDATEIDVLLKNADQAMYLAKNNGRNRFSYFTKSIQESAQKRRQITKDMRDALADQQFKLFYQPIVDLATGGIHKAEALIRWQHPTRGMISPADFIPIAEETGMIVEIGDWVFREAARQVAYWQKFIHHSFQVSINKSPVQFQSKTITHTDWFDYLKELGLSGESIVVEITEGLLLDVNPLVSEKLLAFRDAGVQVSLDDFGTGYSSLSYLKKFDIDYIKIDQSFTRNLQVHSDDMALCEAIIVMAHKLGIKVIAEGIETAEQRDLLKTAGCNYGQGYFFSKPVPAIEFDQILNASVMASQPLYLFA